MGVDAARVRAFALSRAATSGGNRTLSLPFSDVEGPFMIDGRCTVSATNI
jgi:hypothetical protein